MPQWLRDAATEYAVYVARGLAALTLVSLALLVGALVALAFGPALAERFSSACF